MMFPEETASVHCKLHLLIDQIKVNLSTPSHIEVVASSDASISPMQRPEVTITSGKMSFLSTTLKALGLEAKYKWTYNRYGIIYIQNDPSLQRTILCHSTITHNK